MPRRHPAVMRGGPTRPTPPPHLLPMGVAEHGLSHRHLVLHRKPRPINPSPHASPTQPNAAHCRPSLVTKSTSHSARSRSASQLDLTRRENRVGAAQPAQATKRRGASLTTRTLDRSMCDGGAGRSIGCGSVQLVGAGRMGLGTGGPFAPHALSLGVPRTVQSPGLDLDLTCSTSLGALENLLEEDLEDLPRHLVHCRLECHNLVIGLLLVLVVQVFQIELVVELLDLLLAT